MFGRLLKACVVCLAVSSIAGAAEKVPAIGNFPFWSAPKREFCDQFVPGLNAALILTPEQIAKLHEARRETIDSEAMRAATRKDRNATEAQGEAAHKVSHAAHVELRLRASNILTAGQHAIIDKSNAAWVDVQGTVAQEFQPRFVAAKGNDDATAAARKEQHERIAAEFTRRLDGILSSEQKAVLEQAAAREKEQAANPKKK